MSPGWIVLPAGTFCAANTTPYGLTSPFDGLVDADGGRNGRMVGVVCAVIIEASRKGANKSCVEVFILFFRGKWLSVRCQATPHAGQARDYEGGAQKRHRPGFRSGGGSGLNVVDREIGCGRGEDLVVRGCAAEGNLF